MIELNEIHKSFGDHIIFKKFSMKINNGEMVAIIGSSGKGKTTLLNILGGLEKVDSGDVVFMDKNITKQNNRSRNKNLRYNISYLFQNYGLINEYTVKQNLELAMKYNKSTQKDILIKNSLELVGLENKSQCKIYSLSGGEQQRVALARLIVKPSNLILADEPTGNLDYDNAVKIFNILRSINKKGKTVIIVTHDKRFVDYFDKVIDLDSQPA